MVGNFIGMAVGSFGGVVLVFVGASFLRTRAKMLEHGKSATATVLDVSVSTIRRGSKHHRRTVTEYNCTLEFMAGDKKQTVKYKTESATAVGDTIEIAYLPDNPGKVMPVDILDADSLENKFMPLVSIGIGVVWLIVCAIIAFR